MQSCYSLLFRCFICRASFFQFCIHVCLRTGRSELDADKSGEVSIVEFLEKMQRPRPAGVELGYASFALHIKHWMISRLCILSTT